MPDRIVARVQALRRLQGADCGDAGGVGWVVRRREDVADELDETWIVERPTPAKAGRG